MPKSEYLLVIIGLILGLGIAQILMGLVDYLQNRERVRWSRPQLVWMLALFVLQVQYWYMMHDADLGQDFGRYLAALLFPTVLFLATGVLVPKVPDDRPLDLVARYHANQRWFFALCGLGLATLIVYGQLVLGRPWAEFAASFDDPFQKFRTIGLGLVVLLAAVRGKAHGVLTVVSLLVLAAFVATHMLGIPVL